MRTLIWAAAVLAGSLVAASVVAQSASQAPADSSAAKPAASSVNLNTATVEQLEALPGIGRKTAELILQYRQKNGPFKKVEELMNVKGIGEKSFLQLKPMIFVPPPKPEKSGGGQ